MTPTDALKIKLRFLANDKDKKTFTDEELEMILEEADCINCAASNAWMLKAMQYENTVGEVYEYKTGDESYKASDITDLVDIANNNSTKFKAKCEFSQNVSIILGINTEINI